MKLSISWIFAIVGGLIVLIGYFVPIEPLQGIQETILQVAMFTLAFGVLAGVFSLLRVHIRRFEGEHKGSGYSLVLFLAFLFPLIAAGLDLFFSAPNFQPMGIMSRWVFSYLLLPVETTLFALLAVVLIYFAARMLRRQATAFSMIFFGALLIALILTSPFLVSVVPQLQWLNDSIVRPLALGGGRGILLGVALGTIATGIRILMGADRPYG